jgi:hypothetical protein
MGGVVAGRIAACASRDGDAVKCVTIDQTHQGGALSCSLLTEVTALVAARAIPRVFLTATSQVMADFSFGDSSARLMLNRPDLARRLVLVRYPRRLPTVLSVEVVGCLLEVPRGPKCRATGTVSGRVASSKNAPEAEAVASCQMLPSDSLLGSLIPRGRCVSTLVMRGTELGSEGTQCRVLGWATRSSPAAAQRCAEGAGLDGVAPVRGIIGGAIRSARGVDGGRHWARTLRSPAS